MKSDIQIAQEAVMQPISEIAAKAGILPEELELYGKHKAKIDYKKVMDRLGDKKDGKLVLVTAINPTPAGEGKTTTTVGLGQAMSKIGKNAIIALREPSLGPVMGLKGGAAGGGYAQVVPMEDINLHFTGDFHAITAANNLLCAAIDNHLQQGNELNIDPRKITFKRVTDTNDRALRNIVVGLGGPINGIPRQDGFMITVASEIMAVLCLASDITDLKARLSKIVVGYTYDNKVITAGDIKVAGAMAALLKDAVKPNLVQTLENTPCIIHGGPFANIAHGCNSVTATKTALKLADYVITEAGFGADLGAEKFLDIKCRAAGLTPSAVVIVATIRALKYNGGVKKEDLATPDTDALKKGICNLEKHIENIKKYGLPVMVALNAFGTDSEEEKKIVADMCKNYGVKCVMSDVFAKGGDGGIELAQTLCELIDNEKPDFKFIYDTQSSIPEKIGAIAKEIYGADGVDFTTDALKNLKQIEEMGADKLPVCMAKTQYSLSDDPTKLGRPEGFKITVRELRLSAGAGFIVALTGDIMVMPGLPKTPAANNIDVDENGLITGLF